MLKGYEFILTRFGYVMATMTLLPRFRPDEMTVPQVQALLDEAALLRTDYLDKKTSLTSTQGLRQEAFTLLHAACMAFLSQAKSCYRTDAAVLQVLKNLPVKDRTFEQMMARAKATVAAWSNLPPVGAPAVAFRFKLDVADVTQADLQALVTAAEAANNNIPVADQDFQTSQGNLRAMQKKLGDLVTAALAQGRSQFPKKESMEREVIDAIPSRKYTKAPKVAEIETLTSPAPNRIDLTYDAPHATSFDILLKAPGAEGFTAVETGRREKTFSLTALTGGLNTIKVIGHNSRGDGPEVVGTIEVGNVEEE